MAGLSPLGFENYRDYLRQLYLLNKSNKSPYSYRHFAKDLGFNPSNYFHLVINGTRDLSVKSLETLLSHTEWSSPEKNYFKVLVEFNHSDDAKTQKILQNKLAKILGKNRTLVKSDEEHYFSRWYIPILRELNLQLFKVTN